jgi:flotillin
MGQRASEAVAASAKVSIADSQATSRIGATDRNCRSTRETTRLNSEVTVFENARQMNIRESKAQLEVKQAKYDSEVKIAQIESQKLQEMKSAELQRELEIKRAVANIEKMRAEQLAQSTVEAERIRKMAEAQAYQKRKEADAKLFEVMKEAEGLIYRKEKEAEGIIQLFEAQSRGIDEVLKSFGDDDEAAMQFMMLEKDLFRQLAVENGKAIQNMKPQFNIWTTDEEEGGNSIKNLIKSLPPLLTTIKEQTGMLPPEWLAKMPPTAAPDQQANNVKKSDNK